MAEMAKAYDPRQVEDRIYQFWLDGDYFAPSDDPGKTPFTIIQPPPNVTGELHLGHALTTAIEDILTRWHRMLGDAALWLPGTDHSGIFAQVRVEQEIAKEGLTRHDLGRQAFLDRMWAWMRQYGSTINKQHRKLGASVDWSRARFTLDPMSEKAVRRAFYDLYHKGLIYRGDRIINWCPRCATALSDLEVDSEETQGSIWTVRYPIEPLNPGEPEEWILVATTRPETILGDTAVAVHPDDDRYRHLVGRTARVPFVRRQIPIIADDGVDPAFGTGAVKVTPAHDPLDFEIGQRHDLPRVLVMNLDATMNDNAAEFAGLERYEARERVVEGLKARGQLVKVDPHTLALAQCYRCKTTVEPITSLQWWMSMQGLAERALAVVNDGQIRIVPERFTVSYRNWMENIRDWCLSRQIWWGFRIPVWYCANGHTIVPLDDPTSCPECGSQDLEQDPDVFDTWFSSGLWPESTLGWPDDTEDFRRFYPGDVMETGYDILFFWVARMIMLGLENTGEIPFRTVYLHGLVRDELGRKMSKSLGNVVNPIDVMEQYGTDALRFALATGSSPGNDLRLVPTRLEYGRNFVNKLWNASRLVLSMPISAGTGAHSEADRWILSRMQRVTADANRLLADFQIGEAGRIVSDFVWDEFCDWYLEIAKVEFRDQRDGSTAAVLQEVLTTCLRLLHPYIPFVTEEIWRTFHAEGRVTEPAIIVAPYPRSDGSNLNDEYEEQFDTMRGIVRAIRNLRAEEKVDPKRWIPATVAASDGWHDSLERQAASIRQLARVEPLTFRAGDPPADSIALVVENATIYLPREGLADVAAERTRLIEDSKRIGGEIQRAKAKLENSGFVAKAPADVVEKEREKLASAQERLGKVEERLRAIG